MAATKVAAIAPNAAAKVNTKAKLHGSANYKKRGQNHSTGSAPFFAQNLLFAREALWRHPSRSPARHFPLPDVALCPRAAAIAAHRPAKPFFQRKGNRIGQSAAPFFGTVSLQHHALPAREFGQFFQVEHHQFAVFTDHRDMIVFLGDGADDR